MIREPLRPSYDAVVVGALAAGAAPAMLLARAGLRVLAVDRGLPGTDTLSTHALMRAGVLQLHRWGLLDAVIAAGTPPTGSRTRFATRSCSPAPSRRAARRCWRATRTPGTGPRARSST